MAVMVEGGARPQGELAAKWKHQGLLTALAEPGAATNCPRGQLGCGTVTEEALEEGDKGCREEGRDSRIQSRGGCRWRRGETSLTLWFVCSDPCLVP
ncbi:HNH endonuclease [Sesbania bispinosa]|nr:HNH endonuclease [Sesbania bispinosa]